eukprot:m.90896 g.90896  ORF g.90896 m.90896 type:complete len:125 (+) comp12933_c0_seq1:879-1253(+)
MNLSSSSPSFRSFGVSVQPLFTDSSLHDFYATLYFTWLDTWHVLPPSVTHSLAYSCLARLLSLTDDSRAPIKSKKNCFLTSGTDCERLSSAVLSPSDFSQIFFFHSFCANFLFLAQPPTCMHAC